MTVEIALQGESRGIVYEGWDKSFRQCIFEEGEVQGRNERYEFRCDSTLECCGRICCTPQAAVIPLWLMVIFIILALLLLLAILGTIAYLCAKRIKPKKLGNNNKNNKALYTSLSKQKVDAANSNSDGDRRALVANQHGANGIGSDGNYSQLDSYRNGYNQGRAAGGSAGAGHYDIDRYDEHRNRRDYGGPAYGRDRYGGYGGPAGGRRESVSTNGDGSVVRHGFTDTYEASYKEEIVYEKAASTDSKEML